MKERSRLGWILSFMAKASAWCLCSLSDQMGHIVAVKCTHKRDSLSVDLTSYIARKVVFTGSNSSKYGDQIICDASVWVPVVMASVEQWVLWINKYFGNVGPNLAKKSEVQAHATFKSYLKGGYMESMMLSPTYRKDVEEGIKNLNPRKSCGYTSVFFQEWWSI